MLWRVIDAVTRNPRLERNKEEDGENRYGDEGDSH
jgi:hypothetical protein